jgi:iron complex transport system ATP-binding protein
MSSPLIELRGVGVERGKRTILSDVSLEVNPGEVLALVGPNGAGKSTLLATLAGEIVPARGEAMIVGRPSPSYRPKELARLRSVLLQSNDVSFPFRVRQVVQMGRNPWAGTEHEELDDHVVGQAMADVGVTDLAQRRFNELSGGERARVSLARVLAQQTDLLLLDEPTAALDLHHQDRVMQLVCSRATDSRGVVVVLHDLSLAAAYADRVALITRGEIHAIGTPRDVLTAEKLSEIYGVALRVMDSPDGHPMVVPVRAQI